MEALTPRKVRSSFFCLIWAVFSSIFQVHAILCDSCGLRRVLRTCSSAGWHARTRPPSGRREFLRRNGLHVSSATGTLLSRQRSSCPSSVAGPEDFYLGEKSCWLRCEAD